MGHNHPSSLLHPHAWRHATHAAAGPESPIPVFAWMPNWSSTAWLVGYRRLQVRYERRADILLGFVQLACALICLNSLTR